MATNNSAQCSVTNVDFSINRSAERQPSPPILKQYFNNITTKSGKLRLVDVNRVLDKLPQKDEQIPHQLELDLRDPNRKVIPFIPKTHKVYLDQHLADWFTSSLALYNFALRLLDKDIVLVGDLLKLSRQEVFELADRKWDLMRRVEAELEVVGFKLGAECSWWLRSQRLIG